MQPIYKVVSIRDPQESNQGLPPLDDLFKRSVFGLEREEMPDRGIPFAVVITLELLLFCVSIAGALMTISLLTSMQSNDECLDEGETLVVSLTYRIQSVATERVLAAIDSIVGQPWGAIQETSRLYNQSIIKLYNYDTLWQHFYLQILSLPAVSYLYYADDQYGDFVGVSRLLGPTPVMVDFSVPDREIELNRCPDFCASRNISDGYDHYFYVIQDKDKLFTTTEEKSMMTQFAPKTRPWYLQAASQPYPAITWTQPYVFVDNSNIGVTAAWPAFSANRTLVGPEYYLRQVILMRLSPLPLL
ncbi:hypothetical protein HDU76_003672 [Blyttiomyces sp. JEL0837]|nr:hypothetical protein HDU76_003672 [Blyttiomyces sp. JEL0837]